MWSRRELRNHLCSFIYTSDTFHITQSHLIPCYCTHSGYSSFKVKMILVPFVPQVYRRKRGPEHTRWPSSIEHHQNDAEINKTQQKMFLGQGSLTHKTQVMPCAVVWTNQTKYLKRNTPTDLLNSVSSARLCHTHSHP